MNSPAISALTSFIDKPHHGIAIPLCSIHTQNSEGIGEFYDLIPLIDWACNVGLDVIQLLPLNDSGLQSSPYNALSAFALNPIYLSLHALKGTEETVKTSEATSRFSYLLVREAKEKKLITYFQAHFAEISTSTSYLNFLKENSWLTDYALFLALKEDYNWSDYNSWPEEHRLLSEKTRESLLILKKKTINFHLLCQYLCFEQMASVHRYATSKGLSLMGDLPILISSDSCDVWSRSELFDTSYAAGAPPDVYTADGQYWGFPLYNWTEMKRQDYQWWKLRLKVASHFYDLYRLDHVVGFFRIWAIERGKKANEGFYLPQNSDLWIPQGHEILTELTLASNMLPIAEDLGQIPDGVRPLLSQMGICGTKVMRWERRWQADQSFIPIEEYPSLSLTCVSTHDAEPLSLWWKNYPSEASAYCQAQGWTYEPLLRPSQRMTILQQSHASASLFHINPLQEYLAFIPSLNWAGIDDERINIPGVIDPKNWCLRFRPSVEEISQNKELKEIIRNIILT